MKSNLLQPLLRSIRTFIALGFGSAFVFSGQAWAHDPWTTKATMPTARYGPAAGVINGKLYVASGVLAAFAPPWPRFHELEVYDPSTDTWTTKASIPLAIYGAASGVINGKLYVAGGQADQYHWPNNQSALQVYDPVTDTWTTKAPMPFASSGMAGGVINGKLYVAGGMEPYNRYPVNTLQVYDPATDTWAIKTPMPTARAGAGGGVINGIFYAVGGSTSSPLSTVEAYDPVADAWTTRAPMLTPHTGHSVEVVNGVLYAFGGQGTGNSVESYDAWANAWKTETAMPTARVMPAVGSVNGIIYVAGGAMDSANVSLISANEAFSPLLHGIPGPQGPPGPEGPQGPKGDTGATGAEGPAGPQGLMGLTGPQGIEGPAGPVGLTGPQGIQGPAGPAGPQGLIGLTGPQGIQGPAGPVGLIGPQGIQGPAGPQGLIGLTGPQGIQGPAGPAGPQGPAAPIGIYPIRRVTANTSVSENDTVLIVDAASNDTVTLTLPPAANNAGRYFVIKKRNANGHVKIVTAPNGGTIDANSRLSNAGDIISLISDGTVWIGISPR